MRARRVTGLRLVLLVALAAVTIPITAAADGPEDDINPVTEYAQAPARCPGPRCPLFKLLSHQSATSHGLSAVKGHRSLRLPKINGKYRYKYFINPKTPPTISSDWFIEMTKAVARTWEAANPSIRLTYQGTTDRLPNVDDDVAVIGFGTTSIPIYAGAQVTNFPPQDIVFEYSNYWRAPHPICKGWKAGCSAVTTVHPVDGGRIDLALQAIMAHEFAHVLGLHHPDESVGPGSPVYDPKDVAGLSVAQTRSACHSDPSFQGCNEWSSIGLGDILGVKEIYPWKCPDKPRSELNWRWRNLCPTIQVHRP